MIAERLKTGFIALALALCACQPSQPTDGPVRIRFSGYAGNPAETDLMKKLVADFNRANPDIEAVYEPVPGQYYPKLLTMLVSHTAPDVFYLDIVAFKPLLSKHVLEPLDDYVARSKSTRESDFIPSLVDAFKADGHLWGIPKDFNTLALFYDKAQFDKAHLAYPDASWTLDRMRRAAIALTDTQATPPRYGFSLTHDNADRYLPIAREFGAHLFDASGDCTIDSPEGIGALNWYADLVQADHCAVYPSQIGSNWTGDVFGRQQAAMVFEGGWLIPYLADSFPDVRYGTAELPRGPKGRSNFLFTVSYVMPKDGKHKAAAWKLISFLTSEQSQAQVTFALPSRKRIAVVYARKHPQYGPILAGAAYARPYDFGAKGDRINDRLSVAVQEVFLGAKSAKKALSDAANDIDQIQKL